MISNILIYVDDLKHIEDYRKAGVSAFLFGLTDYCVGYNTYSLNEIENCSVSNKYLLLNRLLTSDDIDNLKSIIPTLKTIKGLIFEDVGVYEYLKDTSSNLEMILFQNHLATNSPTVNFWLDRLDSIFISNELTLEEIKTITSKAHKPVCLHLYGYNQVMYSRRLLLSNWSQNFNIPYQNTNVITDQATKVKFRAFENDYGTVMYSPHIFNGSELLNLPNVKYFYVNPTLVDLPQVLTFLKDLTIQLGEDTGFLHQPTIYKLKERSK